MRSTQTTTPTQTLGLLSTCGFGRQPRLLYIFTQSMGLIGIFDKHCVEHNEETVSLSSA